MQASI